jgi:hypothetical protein
MVLPTKMKSLHSIRNNTLAKTKKEILPILQYLLCGAEKCPRAIYNGGTLSTNTSPEFGDKKQR